MNKGLKDHIVKLLNSDFRLDGRKPLDYREPVTVEYGTSKSAEGSATVTIGETIVMAGIKLEIGVPYPDTPDQGALMVGAELLPLSNPDFELGPPSIQAIELARVIDRGIRESHAIDLKKLCIEPNEKAWIVVIDITPINDAGNLFDAGALAVLAALKDCVLPQVENDRIVPKSKTEEKIPIVHDTLSCTVLKIGSKFIVDPVIDEEGVLDARLTVATMEDGTPCAMQKGGDLPLTPEEVDQMVKIAQEKTNFLRKAL
ncbi:exosome complex protein Rrp42 [Candidatus Woesearchaeota archaeon]|nr:exosome complex protein Rrp42 [Candidatus Woesearchaeota archaeon]